MPVYNVSGGGETFLVRIEGGALKTVNGTPASATIAAEPGSHRFTLTIGEKVYRFSAVKRDGRYEITGSGTSLTFSIKGSHDQLVHEVQKPRSGDHAGDVRAPMPALVRAVHVREGERVEPGQTIVVLEAMKMENDVRSSRAGTVAKVLVRTGMTVEKDQILLTLE